MSSQASSSSKEVITSKLVRLSDCSLQNKTLLGGELLKWMDIVACLAGMTIYQSNLVVTIQKNFSQSLLIFLNLSY